MTATDIISIIFSVATIFISVIAIVISIMTAKKSNKIALFEKRMQIYEMINSLITIGEEARSREMMMNGSVSYEVFKTIVISAFNNGHSNEKVDHFGICLSVLGLANNSAFLFKSEISDEIEELSIFFVKILNKSISNDEISKFSSKAIEFNEKTMHKIEKTIKV